MKKQLVSEEKFREEKAYNDRFSTNQNEKKFDPLAFFSRQNMVLLK